MAKKRTSLSDTLFSGIDPYGQKEKSAEATGRLVSLPITLVRPDPEQPRRLLPGNLQAKLVEQRQYDPVLIMRDWLAQAHQNDARLNELRQLADSIARHGLINPITVQQLPSPSPDGTQYLVVTGERRYWSHVLLAAEGRQLQVGEQTDPRQVQALLAQEGISIRAHQLIENLNREDINAAEKAHGLIALREELSGVNRGSPAGKLVPWSEVSNTLGISKRYRIYLTSVLDLCDEAQAIVTAHNLAERTIRPIVQKLKKRPDLQVEVLQKLVLWQMENEAEDDIDHAINNKAVGQLVTRLLARENRGARHTPAQIAPHTDKFSSNVRRTLKFIDKLQDNELLLVARDLALDQTYRETVDDLVTLREHLEQVLSQVQDYQEQDYQEQDYTPEF